MADGNIPIADPNYPLYALSFDTNAPVKEKEGAFRQQIPGSHRLVVATGGRKIRISYEHNDPQNDRNPILNVLINHPYLAMRFRLDGASPTAVTKSATFGALAVARDGQGLVAIRQTFSEPPTLMRSYAV